MAPHANSTPVPEREVVRLPTAKRPPRNAGRLTYGQALPEGVHYLREPRGDGEKVFSPTSILLGAIVSALTPEQFEALTQDLCKKWRAGDYAAMAAFNLAIEGAHRE